MPITQERARAKFSYHFALTQSHKSAKAARDISAAYGDGSHRNKQTFNAMLHVDQMNRSNSAEKDLTSDKVLYFIIEMLALMLRT